MLLIEAAADLLSGGVSFSTTGPGGSYILDFIFNYAISPYDEWHAQAWAGALVLIGIVLVISVLARYVTRARHVGGHD